MAIYQLINSNGVQMTGAGNPAPLQTLRTLSTIAAFAMCLQFQVRRKSIA